MKLRFAILVLSALSALACNRDGEITTGGPQGGDEGGLTPPVISLALPLEGLKIAAGTAYAFTPVVKNSQGATFRWTVDGAQVATEKDYTFSRREPGTYEVSFQAENGDGQATKTFSIDVVDKFPLQIIFPAPMFGLYDAQVVKYVPAGRTIYLRPYVFNAHSQSHQPSYQSSYQPSYQWYLDDEPIAGATELMYAFEPDAPGEYNLSITVTAGKAIDAEEIEATLDVEVVCSASEGLNYRQAPGQNNTGQNSAKSCSVIEYVAAPGQFINESAELYDMPSAIAFAQKCLDDGTFLSLGGFGGYVTVDFGYSIDNGEGGDFAVQGNQYDGSSEPGIVWVSQDTNGNGLPDDEWYELKGSEYGSADTRQFQAVTYFRPDMAHTDVPWRDNYGTLGSVYYMAQFHKQPHYYPYWIEADSYTLFGSCLEARNIVGMLHENLSYDWGYADNCGSDMAEGSEWVEFDISNAVNLDGSPADLRYADFVKVITGVNAKSTLLGGLSTEVSGFKDLNLSRNLNLEQ